MNKEDNIYLIGLSYFAKFGPVRLGKLKKYFSLWENAFKGNVADLIKAGIEEKIANEFIAARISIDPEKIFEKLNYEKISITTIDDDIYPDSLKQIFNPPHIMYFRGDIGAANNFCLAIIGTRKFTSYGKLVAERLVEDLSRQNITIVSGLALGIDAIAHDTAVKNNGLTIGVLGSGVDQENIYPSANRYLAQKIIENGGCLMSEFVPGTTPMPYNFPQRNRVIAGLSLGTVVVEAGEKSGALITANYALEQNREVFAVPGNIFSPVSIGPNELIKKGALPITCAADIINTLDLAQLQNFIENKQIIPETKEEKMILECLSFEPSHINDIVRVSKLDTSVINSTLVIMEMKGMVKNMGGQKYVLSR